MPASYDRSTIPAPEAACPFEATEGYVVARRNLLKAELTYTMKLAANQFNVKEARFGIVGTNLLDDEVRNHVSFRKDEVLLPGRSVRLYASAKF